MGLFSSVLKGPNSSVKLNEQESLLGLMICVTAIDGDISDDEITDLVTLKNKSNLLKGVSGNQFSEMVGKLLNILSHQGLDSLVELCTEALPFEYRNGAFAACCDLVFSDGYVEDEEETFLENLKVRLSLDDNTAMKIVEVISMKNSI